MSPQTKKVDENLLNEAKEVGEKYERIHERASAVLRTFSAFVDAQLAFADELSSYCEGDAHLSVVAGKYKAAMATNSFEHLRVALEEKVVRETNLVLERLKDGESGVEQYQKVMDEYMQVKQDIENGTDDGSGKAFVERCEQQLEPLRADIESTFRGVVKYQWNTMDSILYGLVDQQATLYATLARSLRDVSTFCNSPIYAQSLVQGAGNGQKFERSLAAVLTDPIALESFRHYLASERADNLLVSFLATNALYRMNDSATKRSSALRLYGALHSDSRIGLSDALRSALVQQARSRQYSEDVLRQARGELFSVMQQEHYNKFRKSDAFKRMLASWRAAAPDADRLLTATGAGAKGTHGVSAAQARFRESIADRISFECAASWKQENITFQGALYVIGKWGLIFFARVFGLEKREMIMYKELEDASGDSSSEVLVRTATRTYRFHVHGVDAEHVATQILEYRTKAASAASKVPKVDLNKLRAESSSSALNVPLTPNLASTTPKSADSMTEGDWQILLETAPLVRYTRDNVIVTEGEPSQSLYQVSDGSVHVVKNGVNVARIQTGEVFGEMSFLTGGAATASIVAASSAHVYQLKVSAVRALFDVHPQLQGKFYFYLAQVVASRLREKTNRDRKAADAAKSEGGGGDANDAKMRDAEHDALWQAIAPAADGGGLPIVLALCFTAGSADRDSIAKSAVRVYDYKQKVFPLLEAVVRYEVASTQTLGTLFRGNSMALKCMSSFARLYSPAYLQAVLGSHLEEMAGAEVSYEVDPNKAGDDDNMDENKQRLSALTLAILDSVLGSVEQCPLELARVCHLVRSIVAEKFPDEKLSVGAFYFLRMLNPAIVSPSNSGVLDEPLSGPGFRAAVLVSKILQNLANNVRFGGKEPYMEPFNELIDSNLERVQTFFTALAERGATHTLDGAEKPATSGADVLSPFYTTRDHLDRYREKIAAQPEIAENRLRSLVVNTSLKSALQRLERYSQKPAAARSAQKTAVAASSNSDGDGDGDSDGEKAAKGGDKNKTLAAFGLPGEDVVSWYNKCKYKQGKLSLTGKIFFSTLHLGFQAKVFGYKKQIVLNLQRVSSVAKVKSDSIQVSMPGAPDAVFQFAKARDQAFGVLSKLVAAADKHAAEASATVMVDADGGDGSGDDDESLLSMRASDWEKLMEGAELRMYADGHALITKGERLPGVYQIAKGSVEVVVGDGVVVAKLGAGVMLGEISFLDETEGASATIRCKGECEIYLLPRDFVKETVERDHQLKGRFYVFLANLMVDRLRGN